MVIIIDDDGVCLDDDHGEENGQWPLAINDGEANKNDKYEGIFFQSKDT